MTDTLIKFDDGAAYEQYMGKWSQLVAHAFLDWLAPRRGARWLDVGCGNGAFTQMVVDRCAPSAVAGVDPSEAQIAYARSRFTAPGIEFHRGDAMALPFPDNAFDVAVMPLVIFFVPSPAKGVAEMARVVEPGGTVAAYAWDITGGGFPYQALQDEMRAMNIPVGQTPFPDAAKMDALRETWTGAGLTGVETREITVKRTYGNFQDYWSTVLKGPSVGPGLSALTPEKSQALQARMKARLPSDPSGRITFPARAHAVKGRV